MKNKQAFKNLTVWNESLDLVKNTYITTSVFPEEEQDGIVKAIKKHAITVPGGISKAMQTEDKQMREQFLDEAVMAITEIETLLIISHKLDYIDEQDLDKFIDKSNQLSMQIKGLHQRLNK